MVDWSLGYSAKYYLTKVDRSTMRDLSRESNSGYRIEIKGGSIKRSLTDLRESASIDCVNYDSTTEQIIRVWLDAKQNGESSHTPLFTGLATCPSNSFDGNRKSNTLECYSMLKIAQDVMLPKGWYAPVGVNSGTLIKSLLGAVGLDVNIDEEDEKTPDLKQSIIAEQGETRLSMTDKILAAMGNWRMRLDGYGSIFIEPLPKSEVIAFDSNVNDVIETSITVSYDWYNVPNVLRCSLDDSYAEARDEDINSPLSIQNRGREVWMEETDVQLMDNETLAEYAQRMLKEYQRIATTISYTRRFDPLVYPSDIVRINYPAQDISGWYKVTDQDITLGYNARTSEEVTKI